MEGSVEVQPPLVRRTRSQGASGTSFSVPAAPPAPTRSRSRENLGAAGPPEARPPPAECECALYWDYENMPLGALFSEASLVALLRRVRSTAGRLVEARLYADSEKGTLKASHRPMLERLGVTLIDCPTSDKKEAVDKKIIVDALVWGVGRAACQQRCAVCLISGDGDFAHMLSRLSNLGVHTIVIGRSAALSAVSHTSLSLRDACGVAGASSPKPRAGASPRPRPSPVAKAGRSAGAGSRAARGTKRGRNEGGGSAAATSSTQAAKDGGAARPRAAPKAGQQARRNGRSASPPRKKAKPSPAPAPAPAPAAKAMAKAAGKAAPKGRAKVTPAARKKDSRAARRPTPRRRKRGGAATPS